MGWREMQANIPAGNVAATDFCDTPGSDCPGWAIAAVFHANAIPERRALEAAPRCQAQSNRISARSEYSMHPEELAAISFASRGASYPPFETLKPRPVPRVCACVRACLPCGWCAVMPLGFGELVVLGIAGACVVIGGVGQPGGVAGFPQGTSRRCGVAAGPKRVLPKLAETLKMAREAFGETGGKVASSGMAAEARPKPPPEQPHPQHAKVGLPMPRCNECLCMRVKSLSWEGEREREVPGLYHTLASLDIKGGRGALPSGQDQTALALPLLPISCRVHSRLKNGRRWRVQETAPPPPPPPPSGP
jgi:hypothetical protein